MMGRVLNLSGIQFFFYLSYPKDNFDITKGKP